MDGKKIDLQNIKSYYYTLEDIIKRLQNDQKSIYNNRTEKTKSAAGLAYSNYNSLIASLKRIEEALGKLNTYVGTSEKKYLNKNFKKFEFSSYTIKNSSYSYNGYDLSGFKDTTIQNNGTISSQVANKINSGLTGFANNVADFLTNSIGQNSSSSNSIVQDMPNTSNMANELNISSNVGTSTGGSIKSDGTISNQVADKFINGITGVATNFASGLASTVENLTNPNKFDFSSMITDLDDILRNGGNTKIEYTEEQWNEFAEYFLSNKDRYSKIMGPKYTAIINDETLEPKVKHIADMLQQYYGKK